MEKTIENMDRNRLGILIRCLVILLITGVTNSAAVFVSPLAAHFNWTADAIANVSTTMLLCWTPGALIGGTLMSKIGARNAMLLGAVLFPLGTLTSSFVPQSSPWLLYVTFSFLQGLGNGLAYTVATYAHPRADPRTPQTHRVRPRARGSAAREIRPAAEILIRFLSFRSTPKAPPVFRRGFRDFYPISTPAHSSCSMRENASRNVSRLRTVSCTSGAPSTVTA